MNKLTEGAARIARQIFADFLERGGILRDGEMALTADQMASVMGGLPAILWLTKTFIADDYQLIFASTLKFTPDPSAYSGYSLELMATEGSGAPTLLSLSSFLRSEVMPDTVVDLDLSGIFLAFKAWCDENVHEEISDPGQDDYTPPELG